MAQSVEHRWWAYYLARKPVGDYLRRKKQYWYRILELFDLQLRPGLSVLDAGCGPAGIFLIFPNQKVTAIDPLLSQYDKLDHFDRSDYDWVAFEACALETWKPQIQYDWVFCLNAINHVAYLNRSMSVLGHAVRPGGKLLVTVDVHRFSGLKNLFRWLPGDILHPHQHAAADYIHRINRAGFAIEQTKILRRGNIFAHIGILAQKKEL